MRVIIVDDEKSSAQVLEQLIEHHLPQLNVLAICEKAETAIEQINLLIPDLVFMDIELPTMSGFDILEKVKSIQFDVIFTTAHSQYGIKAIQYSAIDYLLKPISHEELSNAVRRVEEHRSTSQPLDKIKLLLDNLQQLQNNEAYNRIAVPTGEGLKFINASDIIRCMSNNNYTTIYTILPEKILVSKTLKEIETLLQGQNFCRVHNSHLINLSHISKFLKGSVNSLIMADNSEVEVSRRKKEELIKILNL
jgi:two-component system, LytTR family, response regulator